MPDCMHSAKIFSWSEDASDKAQESSLCDVA